MRKSPKDSDGIKGRVSRLSDSNKEHKRSDFCKQLDEVANAPKAKRKKKKTFSEEESIRTSTPNRSNTDEIRKTNKKKHSTDRDSTIKDAPNKKEEQKSKKKKKTKEESATMESTSSITSRKKTPSPPPRDEKRKSTPSPPNTPGKKKTPPKTTPPKSSAKLAPPRALAPAASDYFTPTSNPEPDSDSSEEAQNVVVNVIHETVLPRLKHDTPRATDTGLHKRFLTYAKRKTTELKRWILHIIAMLHTFILLLLSSYQMHSLAVFNKVGDFEHIERAYTVQLVMFGLFFTFSILIFHKPIMEVFKLVKRRFRKHDEAYM